LIARLSFAGSEPVLSFCISRLEARTLLDRDVAQDPEPLEIEPEPDLLEQRADAERVVEVGVFDLDLDFWLGLLDFVSCRFLFDCDPAVLWTSSGPFSDCSRPIFLSASVSNSVPFETAFPPISTPESEGTCPLELETAVFLSSTLTLM
jgi:hypothetical protein